MTLKIRTWVLAAAAVVLVPMILLLWLGFAYIQQAERARVEAELKHRASELAHAVNKRLAVSVQALQTLGTSEAARQGNWQALYNDAKRVLATNPHFTAVTLVDEHNQLLFVTAIPYGQKTFDTSYVELVHDAFRTGQPNVSGPFKTPVSDHHKVAVSVPLVREGRATHVLRMILRTVSFTQLLQEQQLPEGWMAALADRQGTLVARLPSPQSYVGKPVSGSFLAAIKRNDQKSYRGLSLDGIANTALVLPVFEGHWFVALAVPDSVLEKDYQRGLMALGAAIVLISGLGIAVSLGISRFLARQALALERVVATGQPNTPLPWPLQITEFQRIHQSHQNVSQSAQRTQSHLEAVAQEKDEIRDLYENAPCGYHSLDAEGRIVRINQTELDWLGRTRAEVLGQPFSQFITPESQAVFQANYPQFLAQGQIHNLEFDLARADGSLMPVSVSGTLLRNEQGQPVMSRSSMFDISERRKLERQLAALTGSPDLP